MTIPLLVVVGCVVRIVVVRIVSVGVSIVAAAGIARVAVAWITRIAILIVVGTRVSGISAWVSTANGPTPVTTTAITRLTWVPGAYGTSLVPTTAITIRAVDRSTCSGLTTWGYLRV